MKRLMFATVFFLLGSACKERQPLESTNEETAQTADQVPVPEVIVVGKPVAPISDSAPESEPDEPDEPDEPKPIPPPPPPPVVFIKATDKYNEFCGFAKKLEITENMIKLTTENFGVKLESLSSDSAQCIVTMEATIAKGKRLVPVVTAQSYFAGLGMLASGQSLQVDYNFLTLNGDAIEASLEYQTIVQGPIGADTEFVRSLQLVRRIQPPCQTMDVAKRVLVLQVLVTLNKGSSAGLPFVTSKDLPRIDYVLENCT